MQKNSGNIRTFIAVNISSSERMQVLFDAVKEKLSGEIIKWATPDNFHITLRFLGETSPQEVENIKTELNKLSAFPVFSFKIYGTGYFKRKGSPSVLFLKIKEDEQLSRLFSAVNFSMNKLGFGNEQREFKPHLTLGRIKYMKDRSGFYNVIKKLEYEFIQQEWITEIVFYKSVLSSSGPEYFPIQKVKLKPVE